MSAPKKEGLVALASADASATNPSFFGADTQMGSIDYRIPTLDLMGASVNFAVTYDPAVGENSYNASTGGVQTNVSGVATPETLV